MVSLPLHINPGEYDIIHQKTGWHWHLMTFGGKHISGGPYRTFKDAEEDLFSILREASDR